MMTNNKKGPAEAGPVRGIDFWPNEGQGKPRDPYATPGPDPRQAASVAVVAFDGTVVWKSENDARRSAGWSLYHVAEVERLTAAYNAIEMATDRLRGLDAEAAKFVELPIISRTGFTGEGPYVGWRGLGKALNEALDVRDELIDEVERLAKANIGYAEQNALLQARAERAEDEAQALLKALRVAVLALAHASEADAKYFPTYQVVSAAIDAAKQAQP